MPYAIPINTPTGPLTIDLSPGESLVFVGANGAGKTRLTASIETSLGLDAHRIAAHRAISINTDVAKVAEKRALTALRYGGSFDNIDLVHRNGSRWSEKPEVSLLSDSDHVVQALFANHANAAVEMMSKVREGVSETPPQTRLEKLKRIWESLLPHRALKLSADDIQVSSPEAPNDPSYSIGQGSDGERSLFYLLGQALLAAENSVLIIDEPELHVHRSIIAKLWDAIESERPDCAIIYVTHDLDFAASRSGKKFVLRSFSKNPQPTWLLEEVPKDSGFPEDVTTMILGSRRPVLFVEGTVTGLDSAVYNAVYDGWTIVSCGSCQDVIHSVTTMRAHGTLTRLRCAGIVDADDFSLDEVARLEAMGVHTLPVSELENLFALPEVVTALLVGEHLDVSQAQERLAALQDDIFAYTRENGVVDKVVRTFVLRTIDRTVKQMNVSSKSPMNEIATAFNGVRSLELDQIAAERQDHIQGAVEAGDIRALLALFSDKRILTRVAMRVKGNKLDVFEGWVSRLLRSPDSDELIAALRAVLPALPPDAPGGGRATM